MQEYIAAYDFGTSGVKAVLVDRDGGVAAAEECRYPLYTPAPGFVEQDCADYWNAVCEATHRSLHKAGIRPEQVRGLNFSVQAPVLIMVDKNYKPLYPAINWLDGRAGEQAERINAVLGAPLQSDKDYVAKLLWFKENQPALFARTAWVLDCNTYLIYRATGYSMTASQPGAYQPYDSLVVRNRDALRAAGLDAALLTPTAQAFRCVAPIHPVGARELGLCVGTPVFGGSIDAPAACTGAGSVYAGDAHVYFGSSAWLNVLTDAPARSLSDGIYQFGCLDGRHMVYGGCIQSCCMTLNWAIEQFYHMERAQLGDGIFALLDAELADIPAGSDNLLATPWIFGERSPVVDEDCKATFFHITHTHTRRHFITAIMESICYCIRWQAEQYRHDVGLPINRVGVIGGGAQNDRWVQTLADVLQLPLYVPNHVRHAGALGIAFAAGVGLGWYSFEEASELVGVAKRFYPNADNRAVYDKLFAAFQRLYDVQRELQHELK